MASDFEQILDQCIDRVNRGESPEACATDYPQYASRLEPLLQTMSQTQQTYVFTPSSDAKREARQKLLAAMEKQAQPSFWQKVLGQKLVWAAAATAVVVLLVVGYFGLRMAVSPSPTEPPTMMVASAAPNGNFAFLVTDAINAIDEFSKLDIIVDKISLLTDGTTSGWVDFVPEVKQFDLTRLPNGVTQQLWQGHIPEGQYTRVRLYINQAAGTLKSDGNVVDIKIPSDKVQFDMPTSFNVSTANVTSFTYDLTIFNTGRGQGGERYLLKPQAEHTNVNQSPKSNPDKSNGKKPGLIPDTLPPSVVTNDRKK